MDMPAKRAVSLFEPILIEYMSLEHQVSVAPKWDHLPKSWERLRQFGYGYTQAKVEALWAFSVAHEKVIKNSPTLERFPKLLKCIRRVVSVVKKDLEILKDLEPRRYFYAKHILALRFVMNRRLEKLIKFTEEGWVTQADGEGLINALQERIVQTDQYNPCLGTRADLRRCHHSTVLHTPSYSTSTVAAWADLELPRFYKNRRGSSSSQMTANGQSPQARKRVSTDSADSAPSLGVRTSGSGSVGTNVSLRSGYSIATNWWQRRSQSRLSGKSGNDMTGSAQSGKFNKSKTPRSPVPKFMKEEEPMRVPDSILPPGAIAPEPQEPPELLLPV